MNACPSVERLQQLAARLIREPEVQTLTEHARVCPKCHASLRDFEEEAAWQRLRSLGPPALDKEAEERCLERLKQVQPPLTDNEPTVPGYEMLGEIGRGGMGVVYKARQVKANRVVALKMILGGRHTSLEARLRFQIEAEAVGRLSHPNVVQLYEVGEHETLPFFSLEYCSGGSLKKEFAGQPLPPRHAAVLIGKLTRAVAAAHAQGLVHRDLKPGNVLLTEDGTPKITDFGLARRVDDLDDNTGSGAIMGTPAYMSPEQADGRTKQAGPAADIYSLGVLLYEALTGRPPFRGETTGQTLAMVSRQEPTPPRQVVVRIPVDLETICLKCLQKDPVRRYACALELADDLDRFQTGEPIHARPVASWEHLWKWVRRYPAVAGLSAAVAASLLLGAVVAGAFARESQRIWHKAEEQTDLAEQRRRIAEHEAQRAQSIEREALRQAATFSLDSALTLLDQGVIGAGLLQLTRGLQLADKAEYPALVDAYRWNLGAWRTEHHCLERILTHPHEVVAAAYSPDGSLIATGCRDGLVRFWRADRFAVEGKPLTHPAGVLSLAFHPRGARVATSCRDGFIRVWDVKRRIELFRSPHSSSRLENNDLTIKLAYSPDGEQIASGAWAGGARVYSADTGEKLAELRPDPKDPGLPVEAVSFHPDGRILTVANDTRAQFWDGRTFQKDGPNWLTSTKGGVRSWDVAVSPDGKWAATGQSLDHVARLWDLKTRQPVAVLPHFEPVTCLQFSLDSRTLITGSPDNMVRLWHVPSGKPLGPALRHARPLQAVFFRPDGRQVITAGDDRQARVWSVRPGRQLATLPHPDGVHSISFSPDGRRLATGCGYGVHQLFLWDTATAGPLVRAPAGGWVADIVFRPDGRSAYVALNDGPRGPAVSCWSLDEGRVLTPLCLHTDQVWRLVLSPDGKRLAGGSFGYKSAPEGSNVRLWDSTTGRPIGGPLQHGARVSGVAFSPDGSRLLTGSHDRTTQFWDGLTGERLGQPLNHPGEIQAVAFSPNGSEFVTAGSDRTIQRWDLKTLRPVGNPMQHGDTVIRVVYSPDGQLLLSASRDQSARLWHLATGVPIGPPMRHTAEVRNTAYSADGRFLATASLDRTAQLWAAPRRAEGSPEALHLAIELQTGLTPLQGSAVRVLDGAEWLNKQRHARSLK